MLPMPSFADMTNIQKKQHLMRRRFQEIENLYYRVTDDLTQKLADLDGVDPKTIPDLTLHQFSFIKDWQNGDVDSKYVSEIFKTFKVEIVARTQITRRLTNYLLGTSNPAIHDYVTPCIILLVANVVPKYEAYLRLLIRYFENLEAIDSAQEKITWIEQRYKSDSSIEKRIFEITFNQAIHQLESQVAPYSSHRNYIGDNIVCFDEEIAENVYSIHWLFAPKAYIDELKDLFKVKNNMSMVYESAYIKKLIAGYTK